MREIINKPVGTDDLENIEEDDSSNHPKECDDNLEDVKFRKRNQFSCN